MDLEKLSPDQILRRLAARLRHTINIARKGIRTKTMTDLEAKGIVIGRIENILRYSKENKNKPDFKIPSVTVSAFNDGLRFLTIFETFKNKSIIDISDLTLPDLEKSANVPQGTSGRGYCMRCGRTLTALDSVVAGIGPVCSGKQKKR
jgi:hypothetical protein